MDVGALDSTIDSNDVVGDGVAVVAQASTTSETHRGKAATACLATVVLRRDADRAALP
jgi:ketosteroid isomerase-like protein